MKLYGKKLIIDGDILYRDTEYITIYNVDNNRQYKINYNGHEYTTVVDGDKIVFKVPEINLSNFISIRAYNLNGEYLESTNLIELKPIVKETINKEEVENIHKEISEFEGNINSLVGTLQNKMQQLDDELKGVSVKGLADVKNSFNDEFDKIIQLINGLDFYNKEYIDSLPFLKENDLDGIKTQYNNLLKDFDVFINDISEYDNREDIKGINDKIENVCSEIIELNKKINMINISIVSFNNFMEKYKNDYTKLEKQYNGIYTSYVELQSLKIPLRGATNIEPFVFVDIVDGKFKTYSYNSRRRPIGVSDDSGNLIYHGIAKVKYQNDIHVGDFVYGNKEGIAENYDSGFVITEINSDNTCTIFIS